MTKFQDVSGCKFGRLTALCMASQRTTRWLCECECGNRKSIRLSDLNSGHIRSCGCLRIESAATTSRRKLDPSWQLENARRRIENLSIPEDMRSCVNPEHLFAGTQKENVQDCLSKGRLRPRGKQVATRLA